MEIREVTQYNEKAPFTGYGVWIVFEMKGRKAHLIHPVTFTELILSEYEYVKGSGNSLWPINTTKSGFSLERFISSLKDRIAFFIQNKKPFPLQMLASVLSELEEISEKEALSLIASLGKNKEGKSPSVVFNKANKSFKIATDIDFKMDMYSGRPRAILEVIAEIGPATIYEITSRSEGKVKTRCDMNRTVTYFVNKLYSQGILELV